ncbi:hypothetical protein AAY473_021723 [Plecturocebus cupreus]
MRIASTQEVEVTANRDYVTALQHETGFYHVGQGGLKFLTSGDQPSSGSQSAGITGMSHHIHYVSADCFWSNRNFCEVLLIVTEIHSKRYGM